MAINFLNNGVFAGDVTIPEYIYHTGNTSQDRFGFSSNDTFVIRTNGTDKFTADANSAILLEAGITKLQTTSGGVDITGDVNASGNIIANGGNLTINGSFPRFNMYSNDAGEDDWSIINNNGIFGIYNNTVATYALSISETVNTVIINSGNIQLNGTGRITGVDTVSANTDAANKLYVDNAISGVPQGTITGGGQNLRLALWDGSTSIGSDGDFTYNGDTIFATKLSVQNQINTNSANLEINYANGDGTTTNFKNFDIRNGKNAIIASFNGASKLTTLQGDLSVNGDDFRLGAVMLQDSGAGRLGFNRDTSNGAIHDSNYNAFQIHVSTSGSSGKLEIQEYTGAGAFVGNTFITGSGITINDYVIHNGNTNTRFGFATTDTFHIDTNGSLRFDVNNNGMKLGNGNARVTTILDEDNMSSNSATALATQQSVKQYVDTAVSNAGNVTTVGFTSGRIPFANSSVNLANDADLAWDDTNKKLLIGQPTSQGASGTVVAIDGRMYIEDAGTNWNVTTPGKTQGSLHFDPQPPSTDNIGNAITFGASDTGSGTTAHAGIYTRSDGTYGTKMYIATTDDYSVGSKTAITILQNGSVTINRSHLTISTITNSSSDTDKFLVSNGGQVQYRTGDQVRSDIGAGRVDTVSDDGGSTINVSGSATARTVAAVTGAVSSSSANLATGAQIQTAINTAIGTIPSGLAFEGNWDASTGNPPSSSPSNGQFWIVSVAGSTNLSGITDWEVGDWAIYVATGAGTDGWQKVDNTSTLSGAGTVNALPLWTGTTSLGTSRFTQSSTQNLITGPGNAGSDNSLRVNNAAGTNQLYIQGTGEVVVSQNYFYVAASQGAYINGVLRARGGVTDDQGNLNLGGSGSIGNLTLTSNTAASFAGTLSISTITNSTTDTDKFLVSNSGVVQYRTGAQVLSDIGAQASGNYLPVANPTFTGTLTGPTARITSELSVAGAMLAGNTFSDPDLFLTVLDTDTTQSIRDKINDTTSITKVSDSTAPAPGVFAVNGSNYPQGFSPSYTIDEGDTFTFEFWVKKESGTATSALLYAGSNFYNSSGTYLGNSQRYWGESGLQIASMNNWYHVSGTLGPDRGSNTGEIPTAAVSMRLLFLFNYNANASIVTHYCGLKVYKSGQTVTQLYRKTLGSEANTTRNRDLVVDANGDLYGSNLTITGNLIGNTSNTTELGTYSTGAIKRIRMCQGGELHFGDTTTSTPLGITEGNWNSFSDQDRLSIYGRSSITFYAGALAASQAATLGSTGLTLNTITNASASDKFLVSDSGIIKYRTAAQVLSDIGAASSSSLGSYLPLVGGTMSGTIVSTATTALEMDGAASAQGLLMQADSSGTYPVFLRSLNPSSGGETSAWLFKEATAPWGIWHNNPTNSFDWTRAGNNLGIANNVGGQTNSVMIRLNSADGSGTFAGRITAPTETLTGSNSLLLTLNPTANNYGGILFQYGGSNKGFSIYNSGNMIYGGESGVGTILQVNGQNALNIDTSKNATFAGDVTLTNGQLTVTHDTNNVAKIIQTDTSMSNATYTFEVDSSSHNSNMSTAGAMAVDVYSGRAFTIDGKGDIGIGTNAPATLLHVKGDADDNESVLFIENTYSSGGVFFPAALFKHTASNHSYGTVAEFRTEGTSSDRPSILFSNGHTSNNWSIGQGVTGANDNFAIGYRNFHPNTSGGWATSYLTINTSGNATFAGDVQAPGIYVGATNTSFDFYNNGTSYLNGAVTVDAAFTQSGGAASSFSGNVTATDILTVAGAATGNPFLQFTQGGSQKAYIQYVDSGDSFELQSDNQFAVRTGGSTVALTINSSQNATFAGQIDAQTIEFDGIVNSSAIGALIGRNHAYDTLELRGHGAELMIGSKNQDLHINYRTCNNGAANNTPINWFWRAGSSTSFSNHSFGTVTATGLKVNTFSNNAGNLIFSAGNTTTGASRTLNLRNSGSTGDPSSSDDSNSTGITWGSRTDSNPYYIIYPNLENWSSSGNYSKLTLAWHTGIKIGADKQYGGTRFYNNSPDISGAAVILNVGVGNDNIGVVNNLTVGGQATGPAPTTTTSYANKAYVDAAVAGVPQGDVTGITVSNGITGSSLTGPVPAISMSGTYAGNFNFSTNNVVVGGNFSNNAYNSTTGARLMFGGGNSDAIGNYYIGTNLENFGGNYNKLDLRWHTGIRIGAQSQYGGVRIYDSEDLGTVLFSVGTSSTNVAVTNGLTVGGKITANGGIDGLTLANGGISGSNYNITGVNQLTIADPGEGIVFTGTTTMYLNAVDDATDSILKLTNATQLNLNSTARITNLVDPSSAQDAATKNYVDTEIGNIPSGLAFEGNWNASTDTPTLSGTTQDNGKFWIVSVAGSTNLSGITDWAVGDWAIYVDNGAGTDAWQKVDNSSSLAGAGSAGKVTFWSSTSNVSFNNNFTYDGTYLTAPRMRVGDGTDGYFYSDTAGRTAFRSGDFYIQSSVGNYFNYATNMYLGNTTGDNVLFRGSTITGTNWGITPAGAATFAGTVTSPTFSGDLNGTINTATTGTTQTAGNNSTLIATTAYADAAAAAVSSGVTSITKGAGLVVAGSPITTTGSVAVEYAANVQNIITGGSNFIGDTVVSTDQILITDPGSTSTNRRVGRVEIGDLPFTNNTGTVTSIATTAPILGGTITSTGTISLRSPVSGNWFNGGAPVVGSDGLMEVGKYIDFHGSNTSTSDYDVRLNATSGLLTVTGSVSSSSNITSTGYMQSSYIRCTSSGTRFAPTFSFTSDTNTGMFRNGTDQVALSAGGNTRVLCTSTYVKLDGNVGIGRVPSTKLDIDGTVLVKDGTGLGDLYLGNLGTNNHFRFHTNNSNTYFDMNCGNMYWRQGSSTRYTFFPSTANMTINGTLTQNSDVRRKENIVEIKDCISKVKAMRGVYYNRTDINTEVTKVGVIAQEVEAVLPEVILESPEDGLKSVAYSELTSVLINAIKEQQEIIEDLKTRITKLEN